MGSRDIGGVDIGTSNMDIGAGSPGIGMGSTDNVDESSTDISMGSTDIDLSDERMCHWYCMRARLFVFDFYIELARAAYLYDEVAMSLTDIRMCGQFELDFNRLNLQYGDDWRYDDSEGDEAQVDDDPYGYLPSRRGCAMRRRTRA